MSNGDHLRARREQLFEVVDEEIALVVDRRPFDHRALPLAQEVPRHDIGMVLHDGEHDLVARLDTLAAEGIGDEIDGFCGVAREDDLFLARGIEEAAHLLACVFVGFGRGVGQIMQPAMHVRVFSGVGVAQPVEHRLGLLRRGGVVEINERLAINLHGEDRKIRADALDVIGAIRHRSVHVILAWRPRRRRDRSARRAAPRARSPPPLRRRRPGSKAPRPPSAECRAP